MQKGIPNGFEYTPERGSFAAVAQMRGVTRQAVKQAFDRGVLDIIEAVIKYDLEQRRKRDEQLQRIAKSIQ